jgi:hypothetical protein
MQLIAHRISDGPRGLCYLVNTGWDRENGEIAVIDLQDIEQLHTEGSVSVEPRCRASFGNYDGENLANTL